MNKNGFRIWQTRSLELQKGYTCVIIFHVSILGLIVTAWKVSRYGVLSGLSFPVFGMNTEIYAINLQIQSKYWKIRTRKNSVFWHFHAVSVAKA